MPDLYMAATGHSPCRTYRGETNTVKMQFRSAMEVVLLVLAMVLMSPSVSDGRILSKCELRDRLNATLPADVLDHIGGLAKLVCYVNLCSGFNTSKVQEVPVSNLGGTSHESPSNSTHGSSSEESDEDEDEDNDDDEHHTVPVNLSNSNFTPTTHASSHLRRLRSVQNNEEKDEDHEEDDEDEEGNEGAASVTKSSNTSYTTNNSSSSSDFNQITSTSTPITSTNPTTSSTTSTAFLRMYGLFQLPQSVCSSEDQSSANLCNMTCNSLMDDDVNDDFSCLGKILSHPEEPFIEHVWEHFSAVLQECHSVDNSQYFSMC
ncbi:uncharacterized protein LOC143493419 [Brachyhypopomus gauderio]|uniref:uncharacterized protein LOC143493419 n=1 Tax=Brachyhypopomus gauderio TaxID=698409 RepID=UPI004041762C